MVAECEAVHRLRVYRIGRYAVAGDKNGWAKKGSRKVSYERLGGLGRVDIYVGGWGKERGG